MSIQKQKVIRISEDQIAKLITIRQASWYFFALAIYLICALLGFVLAYFAIKLLIDAKIH